MFASLRAAALARRLPPVKPVLALSLAALLTACSSTKPTAGPQVFSWLMKPEPEPVAVAAAPVELEDGSLPAPSPSHRDDSWTADIVSGSGTAVASADDDGLPVPMPPEAAGVAPAPAPAPRRQKGAYLTLPITNCTPEPGGWRCDR